MEQAEVPAPQEKPIISRDIVDVYTNILLGTHSSLFGPDTPEILTRRLGEEYENVLKEAEEKPTLREDPLWQSRLAAAGDFGRVLASCQFDPEESQGVFQKLRRNPVFKGNSSVGSIAFSSFFLAIDSNAKQAYFLKDLEAKKEILTKISERFLKVSDEKRKINDPDLIANISLAVNAAILYGYGLASETFDKWLYKSDFVIIPDMLMSEDNRKDRAKILEIIKEASSQYAEYQEQSELDDFLNPEVSPDVTDKLFSGDSTGTEVLDKIRAALVHVVGGGSKDPLGLNYAVLNGFLVGRTRFEDASRLYQTMTNTS